MNSIDNKEIITEIMNNTLMNPEYDLSNDIINQIQYNERLFKSVVDMVCENVGNIGEMKVTEINLTNNLFIKHLERIISRFRVMALNTNYKLIVNQNNNRFNEEFGDKVEEWDPNGKALTVSPSHLIILRDSLDLWSLDLNEFIQDLYDSIEINGFLITVFRYQLTEPEIAFNSLNTTNCVNNNTLNLRIKMFKSVLAENGFKIIATKYDTIGSAVLLFRKIKTDYEIPNIENFVNITKDYMKWFPVLKKKIITFKETNNNCDNIWLIANDTTINGIIGLMNCLRLEPGGEIFRYIFYNDYNNNKTEVDFTVKPYSDILANDLVANVMKGEVVGTYRHLKLPNDYNKCLSNDYFLNMGQTRDISGLHWFDGRNVPLIKYDFGNNKVDKTRVDIYYSGISSRDISITNGNISGGLDSMFTNCLLGGEYAGRRADTGQRVMGIEFGRCIATHVNACVLNMAPIPDHWSMAEAVTVLNSYSTVYYALIKKANIRKGESVLIHSGAGSVGQAAINVCQHYECDIYVTVGTKEEKLFLIKEYNIPENRIFSSRDMRFKSEIIEATNGRGIDVVLNSLTGKKSDFSFECLAKSGRFIELNKLDHGQNSHNRKHNPYDFDGNIQYIGVSANLLITDIGFLPEFYEWIQQNSNPKGFVRPLNYTVFAANRVVDAFRYMTTGRHIGKVVIKYRDESSDVLSLNGITPAYDLKVDIKTYFNSEKVFIITGGLGGMGLELMSWMHMRGARKFVLTSRSGIKTNYQKFFINRMKSYCKTNQYFESQIIISTANGLTIEGSKQLLSEAKQLGPIGGVFHLALVLNDCLFENMTIEKFGETVDTKHRVFANLDQLTRQLDYKLDYFVVFSSQFTGSGFDGQTNYGFGNSLCERLCEERRRDGLHGLAVQYGLIGDVGAALDFNLSDTMTSVRRQRVLSAIDVLDKLLAIQYPIVTSQLKEDIMSTQLSGKVGVRVVGELWSVLGIDPNTTPDNTTIGEIGLESLFAIQLQHELKDQLDLNVTLNQLKGLTVGMFKAYNNGNQELILNHLKA